MSVERELIGLERLRERMAGQDKACFVEREAVLDELDAKLAGLALYDYGLGGNSPGGVPFNPVPVLADDYCLFAEAGVTAAVFHESEDLDTWWLESNFKPLYNYMVLRLMANPTLNVSDEVQTFMEFYYGPAAKPMRALYDFLERKQEQLPAREKHNGNVNQIPYVTGPAYIKDSPDKENGFWVDRVIMVRAGDAK